MSELENTGGGNKAVDPNELLRLAGESLGAEYQDVVVLIYDFSEKTDDSDGVKPGFYFSFPGDEVHVGETNAAVLSGPYETRIEALDGARRFVDEAELTTDTSDEEISEEEDDR